MFKRMSLALLAGASCLGAGLHQAAALEAVPLSEPNVIYADQSVQRPLAPVRTAYAERSNMGGGFIQFLFGDGPSQGGRYPQQPAYQQLPSYEQRPQLLPQMDPQQTLRQQDEANDPAHRAFDPKFEKQLVDYH